MKLQQSATDDKKQKVNTTEVSQKGSIAKGFSLESRDLVLYMEFDCSPVTFLQCFWVCIDASNAVIFPWHYKLLNEFFGHASIDS